MDHPANYTEGLHAAKLKVEQNNTGAWLYRWDCDVGRPGASLCHSPHASVDIDKYVAGTSLPHLCVGIVKRGIRIVRICLVFRLY